MLKAIIVEDEKHNRETLKNFLQEFCPDVMLVDMAATVDEGVQSIQRYRPDIVFLDIELQSGTGFDVISRVGEVDFDVIFTTAYEHYALKAIKFSSLDYLLKPIDIDELQAAVEKAKHKKTANTQREQLDVLLSHFRPSENTDKKICLATSEGLEFISTNNIICCEANGSYTTFHLKDDTRIMVSKNLKEYETLLQGIDFMRVHNSYLINLQKVKKYIKADGGYIIMQNGQQVSLSPKKRQVFVDAMGALM